jgi:membrane-bound lytic murein transglycosylase D
MLRAVREFGSYQDIFHNHKTRLFKFASRNFYPEFLAAMRVASRLETYSSLIPDRPEATLSIHLPGFAPAEEIRNHFQVSPEDFSRLNPALRQTVFSGTKFIPKGFPVRIPATALTRRLQDTLPASLFHAAQIRDREYIVRRGDTAGSIARRYKISLRELVAANNLNRQAMIRIGQRLIIPPPPLVADNVTIVELEDKAKARPN